MRSLMWFRSDLRVRDNTALLKAQSQGAVIGLFIISHNDWKNHHDAPVKLDFLWRNLESLQSELARFNIPLLIHSVESWNDIPVKMYSIAKRYNILSLHANDEVGLNENRRDQSVKTLLEAKGVEVVFEQDRTLLPLGTVLNQAGQPYKVFTPFKKAVFSKLITSPLTPLGSPVIQANMGIESDQIPENPYHHAANLEFKEGEHSAYQMFTQFLERSIYDYEAHRDIPSIYGTSKLSPYLTLGIISVRSLFYDAYLANQGELESGNKGILTWLNELIWREFYSNIMFHFPKLSKGHAFQEKTESIEWLNSSSELALWEQGQTGIPIVDAFMRQLNATGWMHNRGRMITAMFLSKNLLIDWRKGEQYFMSHLIDGDFASNNGGWQWSASTGTDAVPYFRVFNPVTQSQRFDPTGDFIRQWCPELSHLSNKEIHLPTKDAIVDLKESRLRAIEAFKMIKV